MSDLFDSAAEMARRMKAEVVHKYGDDPNPELSDLPNSVAVVREGEPAIVVYPGPGPESTRQTVYWSATLLRAEALYLIADARFKQLPPGTTRAQAEAEDRQHKLGQYQDEWNAGKRESLVEALLVQCMPAMGPSSMVGYPYIREGTKLTWLEPIRGNAIDGAIPDYARAGYRDAQQASAAFASIDQAGAVLWADLLPEERSYHMDRAAARFVSTKDGIDLVVVLADRSEFANGEELK